MGFIIDGIALASSGFRAEFQRQMLVTCLGGAIVRLIGCRLFDLALTAVGGLIRQVVGVGIVVFAHSPATMTANPATTYLSLTPCHITGPPSRLPAQRLSSTRRHIQRRATSFFEFGVPTPPWMAYTFC